MAAYPFINSRTQQKQEFIWTLEEAERNLAADGTYTDARGDVWNQDYASKFAMAKAGDPWPLHSEAAGVAHDQVKEAEQDAAAKGLHTKYTPDGRAIFRSRAHRRAHLQAYGMIDRNAGYSD